MGGLFGGGPKLAAPTPAPEAPTIDDDAVQKAAEEERRRRAQTGRASTIFTDPLGDGDTSSAKKFLGA